jgi:hypothetical protein
LGYPWNVWSFKQPNNNAHLRHTLLVNGIHNQCKSVKSYPKHLQIKCNGGSCTISKSKEPTFPSSWLTIHVYVLAQVLCEKRTTHSHSLTWTINEKKTPYNKQNSIHLC